MYKLGIRIKMVALVHKPVLLLEQLYAIQSWDLVQQLEPA